MQSKVYIRPHDLDLQLRTLQLKKKKKILISNSQLFAPGTCFVLNQKGKKKRLFKSQIKCSYCSGQSGQANETEVQTVTKVGKEKKKKAIRVDISVSFFP